MARKYNFSDAVLIEFAQRTQVNLTTDLSTFTAFDPELEASKVSSLEAAIDEALGIGTNESVRAEMKQRTEAVNVAMKDCQTTFSTIRYFARKTFKDQAAILRQFGFNEYPKIRQKQGKMITFFAELEKTVNQYKEQLMAKGAGEALLDSVKPQREALSRANAAQDAFISQQPALTADRSEKFNALYDLLLEFSDAAEIVYSGQPEKRTRYSLPHNDSPSDSEV